MDFTARREGARKKAEPFKQKGRELEFKALTIRDTAKLIKKDSAENKIRIQELLDEGAKLDSEAREQKARAEAIENAVYDLKAVNPNAKDLSDKRTPAQLILFIQEKSNEVQKALARLADSS
jgi:type I restriction enzyme M protein